MLTRTDGSFGKAVGGAGGAGSICFGHGMVASGGTTKTGLLAPGSQSCFEHNI